MTSYGHRGFDRAQPGSRGLVTAKRASAPYYENAVREYLLKKRIGVLYGGWSREREISLKSGRLVASSLRRQGFQVVEIDVDRNLPEVLKRESVELAFIALHGKPGEDGTIQGLLETLGIPYTGSGVLASAVSLNKLAAKRILENIGIPTPRYKHPSHQEDLAQFSKSASNELGLPLLVKPVEEGSSIGVKIVHEGEDPEKVIRQTCDEYGGVYVEEFIEGMTATVGILGTGQTTRALPVLELVSKREFYDYEAKYTKGLTQFIIPARLPEGALHRAQETALKAHQALGCWGFSRVDMVVDEEGTPWVLEVNSIPGLMELSDLPAEAKAAGMSYDQVIFEILASAIRPSPRGLENLR